MKAVFKDEDWLAFITGGLIIALSLVGIQSVAPKFGWVSAGDIVSVFTNKDTLTSVLFFGILILGVALLSLLLTGKKIPGLLLTTLLLFVLAVAAQLLAGYKPVKNLGLEYVIFALLLGIAIRNIIGLPAWIAENLHTEFYIKTGLVILGTSIIFGDIIKAGSFGLIQALVVVLAVWYFAFWVCKKLKIDEELSLMLSSAVSICGVSAAIATCGAIQGDNKKLSYVVSLVLIVALPMMVVMPIVANLLHLTPAVAGAWLGGTIDTTGAVVASGALLGDEALKFSTIVKFSQNVLLGFAAIAISVFWTLRNNPSASSTDKPEVNISLIWERFPKFVLGFIFASVVYSFVISPEAGAQTKDYLKAVQTTLFALAFVSTGLETDLSVLVKTGNGKPALAFIIAQLFNIAITLVIAYLLFN